MSCCASYETRVKVTRADRWPDRAPKYIEAANQAKAKYITARDELASHLETCAEATA